MITTFFRPEILLLFAAFNAINSTEYLFLNDYSRKLQEKYLNLGQMETTIFEIVENEIDQLILFNEEFKSIPKLSLIVDNLIALYASILSVDNFPMLNLTLNNEISTCDNINIGTLLLENEVRRLRSLQPCANNNATYVQTTLNLLVNGLHTYTKSKSVEFQLRIDTGKKIVQDLETYALKIEDALTVFIERYSTLNAYKNKYCFFLTTLKYSNENPIHAKNFTCKSVNDTISKYMSTYKPKKKSTRKSIKNQSWSSTPPINPSTLSSVSITSVIPRRVLKCNNNDTILSNQTIVPVHILYSCNQCFKLVFQEDGNFVVYQNFQPYLPIWATMTLKKGVSTGIMRTQGDFVLYGVQNISMWSTNWLVEDRDTDAVAVIEDDGQFVVYEGEELRYTSGISQQCNNLENPTFTSRAPNITTTQIHKETTLKYLSKFCGSYIKYDPDVSAEFFNNKPNIYGFAGGHNFDNTPQYVGFGFTIGSPLKIHQAGFISINSSSPGAYMPCNNGSFSYDGTDAHYLLNHKNLKWIDSHDNIINQPDVLVNEWKEGYGRAIYKGKYRVGKVNLSFNGFGFCFSNEDNKLTYVSSNFQVLACSECMNGGTGTFCCRNGANNKDCCLNGGAGENCTVQCGTFAPYDENETRENFLETYGYYENDKRKNGTNLYFGYTYYYGGNDPFPCFFDFLFKDKTCYLDDEKKLTDTRRQNFLLSNPRLNWVSTSINEMINIPGTVKVSSESQMSMFGRIWYKGYYRFGRVQTGDEFYGLVIKHDDEFVNFTEKFEVLICS